MVAESDSDRPEEAQDFEAIVAALLKVDPEGITGQTGKDAKAKKAESMKQAPPKRGRSPKA